MVMYCKEKTEIYAERGTFLRMFFSTVTKKRRRKLFILYLHPL